MWYVQDHGVALPIGPLHLYDGFWIAKETSPAIEC